MTAHLHSPALLPFPHLPTAAVRPAGKWQTFGNASNTDGDTVSLSSPPHSGAPPVSSAPSALFTTDSAHDEFEQALAAATTEQALAALRWRIRHDAAYRARVPQWNVRTESDQHVERLEAHLATIKARQRAANESRLTRGRGAAARQRPRLRITDHVDESEQPTEDHAFMLLAEHAGDAQIDFIPLVADAELQERVHGVELNDDEFDPRAPVECSIEAAVVDDERQRRLAARLRDAAAMLAHDDADDSSSDEFGDDDDNDDEGDDDTTTRQEHSDASTAAAPSSAYASVDDANNQ